MSVDTKVQELLNKCYPLARDWETSSRDNSIKIAIVIVDEILSLGIAMGEPSTAKVYKFYCEVRLKLLELE